MTTSGTTAFSLTARDIVTQALIELSVLSPGAEPDAAEQEAGIRALNAVLKGWEAEEGLWRETEVQVTVDAGDASVTLPDGVRSVTDVRLIVSATYQRPMQVWTRADYMQVPNKVSTGTPIACYFSEQRDTAALYVWPVPTSDADLLVNYIRGIQTVTEPSQTLDVPESWQEAVWTALAVRLARGYGLPAGDELTQRAAVLYQRLLDADRPDSYFMGPWDDRYYA